MAKPPAYDLSDAEKRDLVKLIQEGRALPDKYRFVLFEDKREVALVWNGKTNEVWNGNRSARGKIAIWIS